MPSDEQGILEVLDTLRREVEINIDNLRKRRDLLEDEIETFLTFLKMVDTIVANVKMRNE